MFVWLTGIKNKKTQKIKKIQLASSIGDLEKEKESESEPYMYMLLFDDVGVEIVLGESGAYLDDIHIAELAREYRGRLIDQDEISITPRYLTQNSQCRASDIAKRSIVVGTSLTPVVALAAQASRIVPAKSSAAVSVKGTLRA
jgi:hypothetical protein